MGALQKAYHAIIFPVYVFTVYYYHEVMVIPPGEFGYSITYEVIGGHWKYLTFLTAVRNTVTPQCLSPLFQRYNNLLHVTLCSNTRENLY